MSEQKKAQIIEQKSSFNEKMGNVKFDEVFDKTTLHKAESIVLKKESEFKNATKEDYENLLKAIEKFNRKENLFKGDYEELTEIILRIKSRAETGGFGLVTLVAKSLFEFCETASQKTPIDGRKVIRLHMASFEQIFSGLFDEKNHEKAEKLVAGLNAIVAANFKG